MNYVPLFLLIAGAAMVGLYLSNLLLDQGIKHWVSRKIGHAVAGVAFLLMPFLFPHNWILAVILVAGFAIMLTAARIFKPHTFRGVGGDARPGAFSELYFPWVGVLTLILGWGVWHRPLEAVACLNMMAWGDCVTGILRSQRYNKPTKGLIGSVAMFAVSFIIAWAFIEPLWLGALAAAGATIVEWASGDASSVKWMRWADDNWTIPVVAALITFGGLAALGKL